MAGAAFQGSQRSLMGRVGAALRRAGVPRSTSEPSAIRGYRLRSSGYDVRAGWREVQVGWCGDWSRDRMLPRLREVAEVLQAAGLPASLDEGRLSVIVPFEPPASG